MKTRSSLQLGSSRIPARFRSGAPAARPRALAWLPGLGLLGLLALPGCVGGGSDTPSNVAGTGRARFFLENVEWGRLVDVFDVTGALVETDVVIRESLQNQLGDYELGINPLTQSENLTILRNVGTPEFDSLLQSAQTGRAAVATRGLDGQPPFSLVARNGALRLEFSEYVDPISVNRQNLQVQVGNPPLTSQEVRYIVRNDQVGADGKPKGVVIIDPTISQIDQQTLGIPQNGVGFPASFNSKDPNIVLRIPTTVDPAFGQNTVLTNLSGNRSLEVRPSDPTELSPSLHEIVVRAFRTGNDKDPYNGFLLDQRRPDLLTSQAVQIANISASGSGLRTLTYKIAEVGCRDIAPKTGDVFEVGNSILQVTRVDNPGNSSAYIVSGALLLGDLTPGNYASSPLPGTLTTIYDVIDEPIQMCWVEFGPTPENGLPARGVQPFSTLTVRFSEPIDAATVRSLETMVATSYMLGANSGDPCEWAARPFEQGIETVGDYIDRLNGYDSHPDCLSTTGSGRIKFGSISSSADARSFTLAPTAGLSDSHNEGGDLKIVLALRDGVDGILDLAGNELNLRDFVAGTEGQTEQFSRSSAGWPTDRYFALRFNSTDENNDGLSEYIGQFVFEPGVLRGRDLVRFSRAADNSNPFIAQRIQFSQGLMTPLTPAGAVLMTCWGYHHLGLGLQAVAELNLDVEGMAWAPFGSTVFDDTFQRYSVALSHSARFPDDIINTSTGYPKWPNSGLARNKDFDESVLGFPDLDELVVTDNFYQVSQTKLFNAVSGTAVHPWNDFTTTYTWRDTAIPAEDSIDGPAYLGGKSSRGAPPEVTGQPVVYGPEKVPSIGLPLLARFRCYPRGQEFGPNGFQVQIMVGSSALPAFRIFSAGGRDASGTWHLVVPDDPGSGGTNPSGGYNTGSGFVTKGYGPELYWQQIDFVLRISRVYTHWFPFGGTPTSVSSITQEPAPEFQPPGTSVVVEYRGTATIETIGCTGSDALTDANRFDFYGNYDDSCGSVSQPTGWRSDLFSFVGQYDYFQLRFTFVSNLEQDLSPELDAFGFAWNAP